LRPGEDTRRRAVAMAYLLALIGSTPGSRVGRVRKPVTLHPGQHHAVTFVNMDDLTPFGHYHSSGFVPKHQAQGQRRVVYVVEMRMDHPGAELFDNHAGRTRMADIQFIDNQRSADVDVDGCFGLHDNLHCEWPTRRYRPVPSPARRRDSY